MSDAVRVVLRSANVPQAQQDTICAAIEVNPEIWDGAQEVDWLLHTHLTDLDWHWQWYDDWHSIFTDLGAFPRMWDGRSRWKGRVERELGQYDHRITLLAHTMAHLHYDLLRLERSKMMTLCCFSPLDDEPLDIQDIVLGMIDNYASPQREPLLPPYFPGDRTGWLAMPVLKRLAPRPYTYEFRPYSRWAIPD